MERTGPAKYAVKRCMCDVLLTDQVAAAVAGAGAVVVLQQPRLSRNVGEVPSAADTLHCYERVCSERTVMSQ